MTGSKPMIQEQKHTIGNIRKQIQEGDMTILYNVRLLKVWCDVPSKAAKDALKKEMVEARNNGVEPDPDIVRDATAFPAADYEWYECPERKDKIYSILCPVSARHYYEGVKYKPDDWQSTGKYNLTIDEFMCNLNLTTCEAQRFLQDCSGDDGQVAVLRDITKAVQVPNPVTNQRDTLRMGIRDVVMEPTEATDALTTATIGNRLLGIKGSPYGGFALKDIPEDYIKQMATPGGLGMRSADIEHLGKLELERRKEVSRVHNYQPVSSEPSDKPGNGEVAVAEKPSGNPAFDDGLQCVGIKTNGDRCRNKGTVEIGDKMYCVQHRDQGVVGDD